MNNQTDQQLLRDYAERHVEAAFAELVQRHVDLVYSAALRMVCDADLAKDVTQGVFLALAQSARKLTHRPVLSGWLHRTTQNLAANAVRADVRRRAREQEAAAMNELLSVEPDATWEHIAPQLDDALGELSEPDRDALLLRYFERQSAHEMAQSLGVSDEAAQKRVSRAVERLREFFAKRGVTVGAGGLAVVISTNAVKAAPTGLAATLTTASLASAAAGTATTLTALKFMATTKLKLSMVSAIVVAGVATPLVFQHQAQIKLREESQTLRQQITQLRTDNESLSNRIAQANRSPSLSSERLRELLRLRGEVGVLRRQQRELEQAAAAAQSKAPGMARQPASGLAAQPKKPSPFQLQLVLDEPGEDTEPMTNHASGAGGETLHVQKTPLLDYTAISSVNFGRNTSSGAPQIDIEFSEVGQELFAAITKENMNKRLAIVLDSHLYSAPVIKSEMSGGKAQITGSFTEEEARELTAKINDAISGN